MCVCMRVCVCRCVRVSRLMNVLVRVFVSVCLCIWLCICVCLIMSNYVFCLVICVGAGHFAVCLLASFFHLRRAVCGSFCFGCGSGSVSFQVVFLVRVLRWARRFFSLQLCVYGCAGKQTIQTWSQAFWTITILEMVVALSTFSKDILVDVAAFPEIDRFASTWMWTNEVPI